MNKKKIDLNEYTGIINKELKRGIYLTTKVNDKVNSMVIGWGHLGRIWELATFVVYVRESRFTKSLLDENPEFTINVPLGDFNKEAFTILGTKSGRDMDKIKEAGLTLVDSEVISVPGIKEFPLTIECKVIYQQKQNESTLPKELYDRFYVSNNDEHTAYIGKIMDAYIIEDM